MSTAVTVAGRRVGGGGGGGGGGRGGGADANVAVGSSSGGVGGTLAKKAEAIVAAAAAAAAIAPRITHFKAWCSSLPIAGSEVPLATNGHLESPTLMHGARFWTGFST